MLCVLKALTFMEMCFEHDLPALVSALSNILLPGACLPLPLRVGVLQGEKTCRVPREPRRHSSFGLYIIA
jgi:hypothetical protein